MKTDNVTDPVKSSGQTLPVRLVIAAATASLVLPLLVPLVCNWLLPSSDAERVKNFFFDTASLAFPVLLGGGGLGAVANSVLARGGKIAAQLAPGFVTDATPNGEGIGKGIGKGQSDLSDALKGAVLESVGAYVAQRSGFDIRDFNIGATTAAPPPHNGSIRPGVTSPEPLSPFEEAL